MLERARRQLAELIAPKLRKRAFEAAGNRRWPDARQSFGRYSAETAAAAPAVRQKARHFTANNALAASGVAAWETALVGAGITATSAHPDAGTRAAIGAAFATWARTADADGRTDLYGLQAAAARGLVADGEAFIHLDGDRVRLIPPELIDENDTRELGGGARVVAGAHYDAAGRRVAYTVLKARPSDPFASATGSFRVSADDMIQVMRPLGAGQVRGVSWLAPVLVRLGELDGIEDALAVGIKVAAMHAGFLTDQNGVATESPYDGVQTGNVLDSGMEPGVLKYLPAGWDIKFSTPQQSAQVAEFLSHEIRAIAAGLGVPQHLLDGNLAQANYSSLRAALVSFRQRVEAVQYAVLIPQMVRPIYERAIVSLILSGRLEAPDFEANAADYLAADFYPPAQPWVDPKSDALAIKESLAAGLTSRRRVVAELGYSVEDLDSEIAADRRREAELGLNFGPSVETEKGPADADA